MIRGKRCISLIINSPPGGYPQACKFLGWIIISPFASTPMSSENEVERNQC